MSSIKEFISTILIALVIAIFFRGIIAEPFSIPSGSMKPNFLIGDYLFVSKTSYGISRHSFAFSPPIFQGRKFDFNKPERGDVVVFRSQVENGKYYIKRLIGLPGDDIQMINGVLYINGTAVPKKITTPFIDADSREIPRYIETLPNGVSHYVLDETPFSQYDNTPLFHVPEGHYFMMGDNRDGSLDSRAQGSIKYVPYENFMGKAKIILFSNPTPIWEIWKWLFTFNKDRFFVKIKSQVEE